MYIIVVGCGKVGYTLVEQLSGEHHNIVVVDERAERVQELTESLDAMGVVGNGISHQTLMEAGIDKADLLVAVTGSDEQNLLCCVLAKKAGHCNAIARVRNPIYHKELEFLQKEFGLAMIINPESAAANEIARLFQFPSALEIDSFANGHVELLHFRIGKNSPLIHEKVMNIRTFHHNILVAMVKRNDQVIIPNGEFVFEEGDIAAIAADPAEATSFFKKLGIGTGRVSNAMIIGGGTIAYYLAEKLIATGIRTTIIEINRERCEELSDKLPNAVIVHGDGTDQNLLLQEGLPNAEGFAALTGLDEENILLSLYAKGISNAKTMTKINRIKFTEVINNLNLDSIVYPRLTTAALITKYVRSMSNSMGSNVENLYRLEDGKAEALEFIIHESSPVVGIPLHQLRIRKNILIACIYHRGKVIIPGGNDCMQIGDSVVVIAANHRIGDINEILEA